MRQEVFSERRTENLTKATRFECSAEGLAATEEIFLGFLNRAIFVHA